MINLKRYSIAVGLACLVLFGYFWFMRKQAKTDTNTSSQLLAPNVEEKIIINPLHRTITIVKPGHTKTLDLPDRPTSIELMKNDGLRIVSPQYGVEARPFVGVGYNLRSGLVSIGTDVFYYKKLDLGLGLAVDPVKLQDTSIFFGMSCFVYSNTSVGIGLDNHVTPMLLLKVRL
jgi:hypothetical protein